MSIDDFEKFVLKAQELGLSELTVGELSFKFAPRSGARVLVPTDTAAKPKLQPDTCSGCGHHLSGHSGAGCIDCRDYNEACLQHGRSSHGVN